MDSRHARPVRTLPGKKMLPVQHMPYGFPRSIKQHPRSGETHHPFHSFPHGGFVTMYGTFLARAFLFSQRAMVEACVRITEKFRTLRTESGLLFLLPAVEAYHELYRLFFLCDMRFFHPLFFHYNLVTKITKLPGSHSLSANIQYGVPQIGDIYPPVF